MEQCTEVPREVCTKSRASPRKVKKDGKLSKGRIVPYEVTCTEELAAEVKRKLTSKSDGLKLFEIPAELDKQFELYDSDTTSSSSDSSSSTSRASERRLEDRDELMPPVPTSAPSSPPPETFYF